MYSTLPEIDKPGLIPEWFPTSFQALIFRNWTMVSKERLADVLETTVSCVETEAERMGLEPQLDTDIWDEKGYISIIRANWHLLPYEQLLKILGGWSVDRLAYTLKEDDFLYCKLGKKPDCDKIIYRPLTDDEIIKTKSIKNSMDSLHNEKGFIKRKPFDFTYSEKSFNEMTTAGSNQITLSDEWYVVNNTANDIVDIMYGRFQNRIKTNFNINLTGNKYPITLSFIPTTKEEYHEIIINKDSVEIKSGGESGVLRALYRLEDMMASFGGPVLTCGAYKREPRFDARFIYLYCGLYDQAFDVDSRNYCDDKLLEEYARVGVNGIWFQAILYRMTEFKYDPQKSEGWQIRQKNLNDFIARAKTYGIKIYLYINEPRAMPEAFFEKYPHLKGAKFRNNFCMCTSVDETKEYLSESVKSLCRAVPGIGGFFTITMSENATHCKYAWLPSKEPCPRCADKEQWQLAAEINKIISEAVHEIDPTIKVIAWDWAWDKNVSFTEENYKRCVDSLPKNVAIQCKRETDIKFERGGIKSSLREYSISVAGVSELSKKRWDYAREKGHQTSVKLQLNNTWECSTTPYLPVFRTIFDIIQGVIDSKVDNLMLSWTLGGYPSPNIRIASEAFFIENGNGSPDFSKALNNVYGPNYKLVQDATDKFCEAFSNFPFTCEVVYHAPQNGGPSNPLYHKPTGYNATMTCYSYDDLEKWRDIYPVDVFENQFKIVSKIWNEGMEILKPLKNTELYDVSYVSYSLFKSSYNQVRFVILRNKLENEKNEQIINEISEILKSEISIAKEVYEIMCRIPEIGYEAANHYYFTIDAIKEKIINCEWLLDYYKNNF